MFIGTISLRTFGTCEKRRRGDQGQTRAAKHASNAAVSIPTKSQWRPVFPVESCTAINTLRHAVQIHAKSRFTIYFPQSSGVRPEHWPLDETL